MRMTEEEYQELIKRSRDPKDISFGFKPEEKKPSKYHSRKCTIIDPKTAKEITFDSEKEAEYYLQLYLREKAGEITDIRRQVKITILDPFTDISGKKHRGLYYYADFVFKEVLSKNVGKETGIVEEITYKIHYIDVKGFKTEVYRIKKKLLASKGYIIEEV